MSFSVQLFSRSSVYGSMSTTYFRIHDTERCAPEGLLDTANQVSRVWVGDIARTCSHCDGSGRCPAMVDGEVWLDPETGAPDMERCEHCSGSGEVFLQHQDGVSVCRSLRELTDYLYERSPYRCDSLVLVEIEGEELTEDDVDAAHGALLVRPTRIVRVGTIDELELPDEVWS